MMEGMSQAQQLEAKSVIREAGLRATSPRIAVYCLLASADRPLSHTQVVEELNSNEWDQATVYRNLRKLVEADLARVATRVDGQDRYELRRNDQGSHLHPHFSCRTCGTVQCFPETSLVGEVDKRWRRSIEISQLQLTGDCPDCLDKAALGTVKKA